MTLHDLAHFQPSGRGLTLLWLVLAPVYQREDTGVSNAPRLKVLDIWGGLTQRHASNQGCEQDCYHLATCTHALPARKDIANTLLRQARLPAEGGSWLCEH